MLKKWAEKFAKNLENKLGKNFKVWFDECGMLHVIDPSGAAAGWAGDGWQKPHNL